MLFDSGCDGSCCQCRKLEDNRGIIMENCEYHNGRMQTCRLAGSYQKTSWENSTPKNRGSGEEFMIKSAKSKIRYWQYFMKCSNNKTRHVPVYSNSKGKDFK